MWHHIPTDQYFEADTAWRDENGVMYSADWTKLWGDQEKAKHGLVFVQPDVEPDARLYTWIQGKDGKIVATPRPVDEIRATQHAQVNAMQYSILLRTDWAYVRLADIGAAVPEPVKTYRDAVRAAAAAMVAAINGATTIGEMATVFASEIMQWPTGDDK